MDTATKPPATITAFSLVLDQKQKKVPRIYLVHNNADDEDSGKPAGWGLPGGGMEKPRDRTPRHAARHETENEAGFRARLSKSTRFFPRSKYGEVLRHYKAWANNTVYIFHMEKISESGDVTEYRESGASGKFSLSKILLMPAARDEDGNENPDGIYFLHRQWIFMALNRIKFNFLQAIPNLAELIDTIGPEELGEQVYWILKDAVNEENRSAEPFEEALAEETEDIEIEEDEYTADWRRWAEKHKEFFESVARTGKI